MERLFALLDVDYRQWKALTLASLRLDLRAGSGVAGRQGKGNIQGFLFTLLFYAFTGFIFSAVIAVNNDLYLTGTLFFSFLIAMVGALVLIEFNAVVVSPDDFAVLAYRPISPQTFFFSRLANLQAYTLSVAAALAMGPVIAYAFTLGWRPLLGAAALAASLLAASAVALTMILLYAAVLRFVHPKRLRRVLSYLQVGLSMVVYGGYVVVPRLFPTREFASMTLEKSWWKLLFPPSWFAGYLELAAGRGGAGDVLGVVFTLAALTALLMAASRKLSLGFSQEIAYLSGQSERRPARPPARRWPILPRIFPKGERRAIALLIQSQFRHDQRFRLSILSILPLTVMYLFIGLEGGSLNNPFESGRIDFGSDGLLYVAVLLFPLMLTTHLANSDSFRAAWVFHATPADKARLVLGGKDFVSVFFLAPYLLFIGALLAYFFGNVWQAAAHTVVLALFAHLFVLLGVMVDPALPFSEPVKRGRRTLRLLVSLPLMGIGVAVALPQLIRIAYQDAFSLASALAALSAGNWLVHLAASWRIRRRAEKLIYTG